MSVKGVVDQRISMGFKSSQTDPIDETREFVVSPAVAAPPRLIWLILPIGIVLGVIYLATRK